MAEWSNGSMVTKTIEVQPCSNVAVFTMTIFDKVYNIVAQIQKGKITTYKEIAQRVTTTPRIVGFALHANKNPQTPCHRVVNRDGRIAKNYAFGGAVKQREKLEKEGVRFKDELHVDLEKHLLHTFPIKNSS